MFSLDRLERPIIAAPMAGGPSTAALAAAVSAGGGLGMLAGGMRSAEALRAQIRAVRRATGAPFGVNVFVPEPAAGDAGPALAAYRDRLLPLADELGVSALAVPAHGDDDWAAKVDVLESERVPLVSFTFGLPPAAVVARLHRAGSLVVITVTTPDDARRAVARGADALCVQGPEAGGHRGTLHVADPVDARPLPELLRDVAAVVTVPVIAAGGLVGAAAMAEALRHACAVQLGTVFLLSDEAGTSPAYRRALTDPAITRTRVTRAFSGRPARGLENAFIERYDGLAPAAYPEVNALTAPLRRAATEADDPRWLSLWAGTGWRQARRGPAGRILEELDRELRAYRGWAAADAGPGLPAPVPR